MLAKHDLTAASFLSFSTTFEHGYTCKQEFTFTWCKYTL